MRLSVDFREAMPVDPSAMRHASTILPLPDGTILGAYFAGTYEAEADTAIYLSRRDVSGAWSPPKQVSTENSIAHWNPVLALRANGEIVLFYKSGFLIESWRTMFSVSTDGGLTWAIPRSLVPGDEGGRGPVRNKVLVTRSGRWIAGASLERGDRWTAFADLSDDEGETWRRGADLSIDAEATSAPSGAVANKGRCAIAVSPQSFKGRGVIQPTLWEDDFAVKMFLRSTEGHVYYCLSEDCGETWTSPRPTTIPNNNSALDVLRLADGTIFLAHNPIGGNWGNRTPLVISVSYDGGATWVRALTLDEGKGEYSYPAIVTGSDGFFVSWTRNRKEIAVARVSTRQGRQKGVHHE